MNAHSAQDIPSHSPANDTDLPTLYCKREFLRSKLAIVRLPQDRNVTLREGDHVRLIVSDSAREFRFQRFWQVAMIDYRDGAPYAYCIPDPLLNNRAMMLV